jgi:hypothetical protein
MSQGFAPVPQGSPVKHDVGRAAQTAHERTAGERPDSVRVDGARRSLWDGQRHADTI